MQELERHRRVVPGTQVVGILRLHFNGGLKDVNFAASRSCNVFGYSISRVMYLFELGTHTINGSCEIIYGFLITSNVRN